MGHGYPNQPAQRPNTNCLHFSTPSFFFLKKKKNNNNKKSAGKMTNHNSYLNGYSSIGFLSYSLFSIAHFPSYLCQNCRFILSKWQRFEIKENELLLQVWSRDWNYAWIIMIIACGGGGSCSTLGFSRFDSNNLRLFRGLGSQFSWLIQMLVANLSLVQY